jgi:hypothetical protein
MSEDRRDFFISHSSADERWAEWIAVQLERVGYRVELDVWEWMPGSNFIAAMEGALQRAERVIAVYSASYFTRPYSSADRQAPVTAAFREHSAKVIPVQVDDCEIPDLYHNLACINLTGLEEHEAVERLVAGVAGPAERRDSLVAYPGKASADGPNPARYPDRFPGVWRMPPRNRFFVGRQLLINRIGSVLQQPDGRPAAVTSLQGIGGIGKTQIAIEYAYERAYSYSIAWWVDADSQNLIVDALVGLAGELGLTGVPPEQAIECLWRELQHRRDWILIYDNVDQVSTVSELQPPNTGHWLLTSRDPAITRIAQAIEVQEFERAESIKLFELRVPSLAPAEAAHIAEALGDLPLAVEQAAYFLAETGLAPDDYVHILHSQPTAAGLAEVTINKHPGLVSAITTTMERLEIIDPGMARTAKIMSILAPEPLPIAIKQSEPGLQGFPFGLPFGNAAETANMIRRLTSTGLVKRVGRSLQMHRLMQLILTSQLSPEDLASLQEEAALLLASAHPGSQGNPPDWPNFAILAPHVAVLSSQDVHLTEWNGYEEFAELVLKTVAYFYRSGRFQAGLELARNCLESWQESLGSTCLLTLRLKNNLGMCMTGLGQFTAATHLYRELHLQYAEVLGPLDTHTLRAANNIGVTLMGEKKYNEAVDILTPTVATMRSVAGDRDLETLRIANNLAEALVWAGATDAATRIATENLRIRQQIIPALHPDILESSYTLGIALAPTEPGRARELLTRTLETQARVLGEAHPDTTRTATALASLEE